MSKYECIFLIKENGNSLNDVVFFLFFLKRCDFLKIVASKLTKDIIMKHRITFFLIVLIVFTGVTLQAQEVTVGEKVYEVKETLIFQGDTDVTKTLTVEEKTKILTVLEAKQEEIARLKKEETQKATLEKATVEYEVAEQQKKEAEKALKKAEKAQKKMDKAKAKHAKAKKVHSDTVEKYEKLKGKGKLSPVDEGKWLKKIEKLKTKMAKAKSKL